MSGLKDQALMAYVDGELDEVQRQGLEASISGDPRLAAEVERQRVLRARVQDAFLGVDVSQAELSALDEPPLVLGHPPVSARLRRRARTFRPVHWAAMAACLAVGAGIGLAAAYGPALIDPPAMELTPDGLVARGALAEALAGATAEEVRVGDVAPGADGAACRTFVLSDPNLSGLACREGSGWAVRSVGAGGD
ncbi:MAG: hypothetical protein RBS50_01740 [Phenylobacterium sp.]|uniref:anti-sigma factor family protein n=2 Tax=Phenylobacterium sp. TaxID=1871053 RepID=UPI002A3615A2|nr:hypothetical protein [Phenylobacterium sp.]MDX9996661.1 hypothetical protein [Phenylobacterium sp.]